MVSHAHILEADGPKIEDLFPCVNLWTFYDG